MTKKDVAAGWAEWLFPGPRGLVWGLPKLRALVIDCFHDTWRRIPLDDRRTILRFWQSHNKRVAPWVVSSPVIRVSDRELVRANEVKEGGPTLGMVISEGHEILLRAEALCQMSNEVIRTLIAHELGHVFHFARGLRLVWYYDGLDEEDRAECYWPDGTYCEEGYEGEAISACDQRWNFDDSCVDTWAVGKFTVIS